MSYATIRPPFTLKFREMSAQELKDYFRWFHNAIPERIQELARAVRESKGFGHWQPDNNPNSLESLGDWFAGQIETRPRTDEELQAVKRRSAFGLDGSAEELTNRTFSLAMDIGMYIASVLLSQHRHLRWHQPLDDKKFVDYGQPVLIGFGVVPLNPVRIVITLAYGLAKKRQTGRRLRELYDYWSKQATAPAR
jgi:hypothetical protein